MARRNKLSKFSEVLNFPNVVENYDPKVPVLTFSPEEDVDLKGKWKSHFFKNDSLLIVELACGRGEYSLALGQANPTKNYLGVDIKGARIWKGAKAAIDEGLDNVKFLRCKIELIESFFASGEIDEIWITFPDPFHGKENRRLTAHSFLKRYRNLLRPSGLIHLKTDDDVLYEFSSESVGSFEGAKILYQNDDIYKGPLENTDLQYKTYYELQHLSNLKTIKYLRFQVS